MRRSSWRTRFGFDPTVDVLEPYRDHLLTPVSLSLIVYLTPFVIRSLLLGATDRAVAIGLFVVILLVNAQAVRRGRRAPIPLAFTAPPLVYSIYSSFHVSAFSGALWSFQTVLLCHFLFARPLALAVSAAVTLIGGWFVLADQGGFPAAHFVFGTIACVAVLNIVLTVIGALQRQLREQAITDPLTGTFNRREMDATLIEAVTRARRDQAPVSLLIIDIDRFKAVNDDHGHEAGDAVLRALVALIQSRARRLDQLFRMGGEEFALLLPGAAEDEALMIAERLRTEIAAAPLLPDRPVTVSIGVGALAPDETPMEWLARVDSALYRAKNDGRDRVRGAGPARVDASP